MRESGPALTALTTARVCAFIVDHRDRFGSLRSAACCPSTASRSPRARFMPGSAAPSKRSLWGRPHHRGSGQLLRTRRARSRKPESLYGSLKMWRTCSVRCPGRQIHVERLMRAMAGGGDVPAAEVVRTTIADPAAVRSPDLVDRQFVARRIAARRRLHLCQTHHGVFVYVASSLTPTRSIVAGSLASKQTRFVSRDRQARTASRRRRSMRHPPQRCRSQYTSVRFVTHCPFTALVSSVRCLR